MHRLKALVVLLCATAAVVIGDNDCVQTLKVNVTLYRYVDSASEITTVDGQIRHKNDLFHLLVVNQTVPQLCENYVFIENELSILQLINSSIEEIRPGAFNITPSLALLRIILNPITRIEKSVFNEVPVKEIDLSDNRLSSIHPEAFDNNTYLQILKLNNNLLQQINPDWFTNSPNVYKFSIIYNDIKNIPGEAFKNMAKNRSLKLRLSANRIKEISPDAFSGHRKIQVLRLNGNKIATLPENIFVNRTIGNLQINTNRLQCFPETIYNASIEILAFVDNPFECNCLKRAKKFADENGIEVYYPSVICEDRSREVNIVFNFNKTYELPLLPPAVDEIDVYAKPDQTIQV